MMNVLNINTSPTGAGMLLLALKKKKDE